VVIIDTTVWIDYLRGSQKPGDTVAGSGTAAAKAGPDRSDPLRSIARYSGAERVRAGPSRLVEVPGF